MTDNIVPFPVRGPRRDVEDLLRAAYRDLSEPGHDHPRPAMTLSPEEAEEVALAHARTMSAIQAAREAAQAGPEGEEDLTTQEGRHAFLRRVGGAIAKGMVEARASDDSIGRESGKDVLEHLLEDLAEDWDVEDRPRFVSDDKRMAWVSRDIRFDDDRPGLSYVLEIEAGWIYSDYDEMFFQELIMTVRAIAGLNVSSNTLQVHLRPYRGDFSDLFQIT